MPDQHNQHDPPKRHSARLYPEVAQAIESALGTPMDDWIARQRLASSWRSIAQLIYDRTGYELSHNTLAGWYPEHDADAIRSRRQALAGA